MKRWVLSLLIAAAVFLALQVENASAYVYRACDGTKISWPVPAIPIHPATISFPSGSARRAALERARAGWNLSVPARVFTFAFGYTSSTTWESGDGVNQAGFTSDYGWTTELAVTITSYDCDGLAETDVLFRPSQNWNYAHHPAPDASGNHFVLVALHELGHALGLRHEDRWMATMNSFYPNSGVLGNENDPDPHGDDCAGDRFLYGSTGSARDLALSVYQRTGSGSAAFISPPSSAKKGSTKAFTFTLLNRGTENQNGYTVKVYSSNDRWITTGDTLLGTATYNQTPGSNMTVSLNIFIPNSLTTGNHYIGFVVDPTNAVGETAEDQNAVGYVKPTYVY
jgi:hypothetical protein